MTACSPNTTSSKSLRIAVFGPTGGCVSVALARALRDGHCVSALARSPTKLLSILETQHGLVGTAALSALTIVSGNARDPVDVARALTADDAWPGGPDHVLGGVGGAPVFSACPTRPTTVDDPTICATWAAALVAALRTVAAASTTDDKIARRPPPAVIAISTTGIPPRARDVPLAFLPLYHWVLAEPHRDKQRMEAVLTKGTNGCGADTPALQLAIVRPSFMTGVVPPPQGSVRAVRVGWEQLMPTPTVRPDGKSEEVSPVEASAAPGPAVGYTIAREDVGTWIYENLVAGDFAIWASRAISLTY